MNILIVFVIILVATLKKFMSTSGGGANKCGKFVFQGGDYFSVKV